MGVVLHIFLGGYCCYAARIGVEKSHRLKSSVVVDLIQCFSFRNVFFSSGCVSGWNITHTYIATGYHSSLRIDMSATV